LQSISILTPYFARHWRGVGGVLVLAVGTAWVNALEPAVLKTLFDRFVDSPSLETTIRPFALLIGILAFREILSIGQNRLFWRVRTGIHQELLRTTVERLHSLPLSFHRDESVGTTMNKIERGINSALQAFEEVALQLVPSVIYLVVSIRIMLNLDARLSAIVLAFAPLPALVGVLATREQVRRERTLMHRWTRIFGRFNEMLTGIVVVKSLAMEEAEKQRFVGGVRDVNRVVLRGVTTDTRNNAIKNSIAASARICVLAMGGFLVMKGQITIGTIVAFASYVSGLFQPLQTLTGTYQTLCKAAVSVKLGLMMLEAGDCIGDEPGAADAGNLEGEIEFRGVNFAYRPGAPVLSDVSLHVRPGETVALVGPSGAGKSTLMALLQRLYDPTSGSILVDGRDIKTFKQRSLRSRIGVVLQENLLFNDTISANIAFGNPSATQGDIERAARAAHAHDFITAFPDGYLTGTGERGSKLSGGERQRVAIARTLLKDASILVFDEATSSLDPESEEKVQDALWELARGRTTFVIAHRLSTVISADRIVVLKDGSILETGTHAELMARRGYYASLMNRQTRRFALDSSPRATLDSTPDESDAEMLEPSFASSR
jgi:ATP-binding cassette subfamily B protein